MVDAILSTLQGTELVARCNSSEKLAEWLSNAGSLSHIQVFSNNAIY